MKTNRKCR